MKKFAETARQNLRLLSHSFTLDFVVTAATPELIQNKIKPAIEEYLQQRGLMLSETKTKITHIEEGFNFLGFNVRKYNGKFLSKPSKESVKLFLKGVKVLIKKSYGWKAAELITLLNPKIKGWANYYKATAAKATFGKIDDVTGLATALGNGNICIKFELVN